MDRTTLNQIIPGRSRTQLPSSGCQIARCVGVWAGPVTLGSGTVSVPLLELRFRLADGTVTTRRFLLDRNHPQRLKDFLEGFLGRPLRSLWEWDPDGLVGRRGPIPTGRAKA